MTAKNLSKIILGFALSLAGFFYAFKEVDLHELVSTIQGAALIYLAASIPLLVLSIVVRGLRWAAVSGDGRRNVSRFYSKAIVMGAFTNQVLPLRVGEFVRVFALKRLLSKSMTEVVATSVLDRLVEVSVLLVAATALGLFSIEQNVFYAFVLVAVFLILLMGSRKRIVEIVIRIVGGAVSRFGFDPNATLEVLRNVLKKFFGESPRILLLSALILLLDYLFASALMKSLGLEVPLIAPLMLITSFAFCSALPSAPAYVGIYQAAAVFVLGRFGVDGNQAVAVATLIQIITLCVLAVCSAGVVWSSPKGLFRTVRSAVHVAEHQAS